MTEREKLEQLEAEYAASRRARIADAIDRCVTERRIPASLRDRWLQRCLSDETGEILAHLQEFPPNRDNEPVVYRF